MYSHRSFNRLLFAPLLLSFFVQGAGLAAEDDQPLAYRSETILNPFARPEKGDPAAQLAYAEALRETRPRKAAKQFRALVKRWPDAPEAALAQKAYAEWLLERGKYFRAFDAYEILLDQYAGSFPGYDEVLATTFDIAKTVMVRRKAKFLFLPGFVAPEEALPMLESVVAHGPRSVHAAEAQYLIGEILEKADKYEEALLAYEKGHHDYPRTPFAAPSEFGYSRCLVLLADEKLQDMDAQKQAYAALTIFLNKYPDSERADVAEEYRRTLRRRMARAAYNKGVFYERVARKPEAALMAYKQFIKDYPSSEWTGVAEIRIDALSRTLKGNDEG